MYKGALLARDDEGDQLFSLMLPLMKSTFVAVSVNSLMSAILA